MSKAVPERPNIDTNIIYCLLLYILNTTKKISREQGLRYYNVD